MSPWSCAKRLAAVSSYCCGNLRVLDAAGGPLERTEFEHAFRRELTHGDYLARFGRIHQFRAFQGAVLADRERSRTRPADPPS